MDIEPTIDWHNEENTDSRALWDSFALNTKGSMGIFSLFATPQAKLSHYSRNEITTSPFAHFPIVSLYRLDSLTGGIVLNVTPMILAGVFEGSIRYAVCLFNC